MIRFFWNGLKVDKGKLIGGHWSHITAWTNAGGVAIPEQIKFYCRDYEDLPSQVRDEFDVQNDTDIQTDYFEHDKFAILPSSPRWTEAMAMVAKLNERYGEPTNVR